MEEKIRKGVAIPPMTEVMGFLATFVVIINHDKTIDANLVMQEFRRIYEKYNKMNSTIPRFAKRFYNSLREQFKNIKHRAEEESH